MLRWMGHPVYGMERREKIAPMTTASSTPVPLRDRGAWKALENHFQQIGTRHLREIFAEDSGRGERLTAEAAGIFLDYSKNRVTDETMRLLVELAAESGVPERRDAM